MPGSPTKVLFDPRTREIIRGAEARTWIVLLVITTLVVAGGMGVLHYEWPIVDYARGACSRDAVLSDCVARTRTSLVVALVAGLLAAPLSILVYRRRPIRPTVTCERCGGMGWVLDLEPANGRCPRCGYPSFTYQAYVWQAFDATGGIRRIVEHDMSGADLIRRFHQTRRSALARYY
jgi:ribosomal protein L37E